MSMPGPAEVWIAGAYLGMSLLTFSVYAIDKAAARAGGWRTVAVSRDDSVSHAWSVLTASTVGSR